VEGDVDWLKKRLPRQTELSTVILVLLLSCSKSAADQHQIDSLTAALSTLPQDTARVMTLTRLAYELFRSDPERTRSYGEDALNLATMLDFKEGIARSHRIIGIYHWARGDYREALRSHLTSLQLSEEMEDHENLAMCYNNIGAIYHRQTYYERAIEFYLKALSHYEALNDSASIATAYNNIGTVMRHQGEHDKALDYYLRALDIYGKVGSSSQVATSYYNIGVIYLDRELYDKALEYYEKTLEIRKETGDKRGMATSLQVMGAVYRRLNELEKALSYYQESLVLARELGEKNLMGIDLVTIGNMVLTMGDLEQAAVYLRQGLAVANEAGARHIALDAYYGLSRLYERKGDYKSALENYRHYAAMDDSIYDADRARQVAELQRKYETEQLEGEIQLLNLDNQRKDAEIRRRHEELSKQRAVAYSMITIFVLVLIFSFLLYRQYSQKKRTNVLLEKQNLQLIEQQDLLSAQRDELELLNATKDKFFAIIAHDLRNPLTALVSTTRSLSEGIQLLSKDETQLHMTMLNRSAQRLFNLVENLLQWAVSQTEGMQYYQKETNLSTIVNDVLLLFGSDADAANVSISTEIDSDITVSTDSNMLRVVLRNLIGNAIKFSDEGGVVSVKAGTVDDAVEVSITDSGIGISEDECETLFQIDAKASSGRGTREKGTGLGLILCKEFVSKMGGRIWVDSEVERGSTFHFTIPHDGSAPAVDS
jgi:signal transduction histidine kinase/Tfp pilus assembly protein PilF